MEPASHFPWWKRPFRTCRRRSRRAASPRAKSSASTCSGSGCTRRSLHAAITVNPKALELAEERDRERAAGRIRGPLHGIPIALKDNVHTTFMRTTGGALAFENLTPPYDATLTKNLIDAGAIIIAKTGMSELANFVAGAPTPMPADYNAVGGQGYNPYDPRKDPREATFDGRPALQTGGSSSGDRHRGEFLGRQRRQRNVGIDPQPVEPEHARRDQADGRPHQPVRRDSHHRRSGHGRSDGKERGRRRDHVWRDGKRVAGSQRSRDQTLHAGARARLYDVPEGRRTQGRAHRHSARVVLRRIHAARSAAGGRRRPRGTRRWRRRRQRAEPGAEEGDGRRDRRPQGSRGRSSSIRRTFRAWSIRIRRTTSCAGTAARAPTTRKARTRTARSC